MSDDLSIIENFKDQVGFENVISADFRNKQCLSNIVVKAGNESQRDPIPGIVNFDLEKDSGVHDVALSR